MDRRKIRGGGLHRNLIRNNTSSQLSSESSTLLEYASSSLVSQSSTRKRKSKTLEELDENHTDSGQSQSPVEKRKRQDTTSLQDSTQNDTLSKPFISKENHSAQYKRSKDKSQEVQSKHNVRKEVVRSSIQSKRVLITDEITKETYLELNINEKLLEFLQECGLLIENDEWSAFGDDPGVIRHKMSELLKSGSYQKSKIIESLARHFENENNINRALNHINLSKNNTIRNTADGICFIKILLQTAELHPELYSYLITKLNESILLVDSIDEIQWSKVLLQQFRFLDVSADSDVIANHIEQLVDTSPKWFLKELVIFLPDILTTKYHESVTEILIKILEENLDLTNVILDCISSLSLGKDCLDKYRKMALDLMKRSIKTTCIPAIIRFVLEDGTSTDTITKAISELRMIKLEPLRLEAVDNVSKDQLNIINTFKMNMLVSKDMINTIIGFINDNKYDPEPLDFILLLLVYMISTVRRRKVENIFIRRIKTGFYRLSHLQTFYSGYKKVVRELQMAVLHISSRLLTLDERVFIDFAINWVRLQFHNCYDAPTKQRDILRHMIFFMSSSEKNAKNALTLLCQLVENDGGRQYSELHCHQLRMLLVKVDNFDLEEVGILNDLLYSLCTGSNPASESLREDLYILFQKQLCDFRPLTKSKGVLAATRALKYLMISKDSTKEAQDLFNTVLNNVKNCLRSQCLFYDELADIMTQTRDIDIAFVSSVIKSVEEEFFKTYVISQEDASGDMTPRFGLNDEKGQPQSSSIINFHNNEYGAIVPISFKLLKICYSRRDQSQNPETINILLRSAILIAKDFDEPEDSVLNTILYSINWFRELINGLAEDKSLLIMEQVVERLDNLIYLEEQLYILLHLRGENYQPPLTYFHSIHPSPFIKIEKKIRKKKAKAKDQEVSSNNSSIPQETVPWKPCPTLSSKNPMYFRSLQPKIINLLDTKSGLRRTQSTIEYHKSIKRICFVVCELLGALEHECNETFITSLISFLPNICTQLDDMIEDLRKSPEKDEVKHTVRLLLSLLGIVVNWKPFETITYKLLLQSTLKTLARQTNREYDSSQSLKEHVADSCTYFASMFDIATQISLAVSLINICQSLMKYSGSYMKEYKDKHAKMAFSFLCVEWAEETHTSSEYRTAVSVLLNNWLDYETNPLQTISNVMKWLPEETCNLKKAQDYLKSMSSIQRTNFPSLYKKLFDGLINGVKIGLSVVKTDIKRIGIWNQAALIIQRLIQISKTLKMKSNIAIFLKHMPLLLRIFLNKGISMLEQNLKYETESITTILKLMQGGTRYLHAICCDATEKRDVALAKFVPAAKSILEELLYRVKGMLVLNNSSTAFWMGNLINKNLEGSELLSQNSSEEILSNETTDTGRDVSSEILDKDSGDASSSDEYDDE